MSKQLQEFVRQTIAELLKSLSPEECLKGLSLEECLAGLTKEESSLVLEARRRFLDNASSSEQQASR